MNTRITFSFKKYLSIFLVIGLFLLSQKLDAQVTVDAVSTANSGGANVSSLSWNHTVTSSDCARLLLVGIAADQDDVSGVTYNGAAMTLVDKQVGGESTTSYIYYLVAPATGTNSIVVSLSDNEEVIACGISFTNVHQTTPLGTAVKATAASATASTTVASAAGEFVFDAVSSDDNALTVGAGQASRQNITGSTVMGGMSTEAGAASVTMSWTLTSDNWTSVAVPVKPLSCGIGGTSSGPAAVCTGNTAALSLSGYVGCIQWQRNVNAGGWTNIAGATSSSYTTGALTFGNSYQYRAVLTANSCSANSTTTTVTVDQTPTVSAAGVDQSVCTTTATMAGNTPAVGTGTWTLVSGTGTITTPSSATSGLTALAVGANTFRWTIANGACTSSTDDVIITNATATGGTATATSTCGNPVTLSLAGENGTIQWQQSVVAGVWTNIAGGTTDPYSATIVYASAYDFRAVLTTACGTANSSTASIAAGGAATNYTFTSPSLALSTINGDCLANYTFTQSTTAARSSAINAGVTVTINFMAGTDATTMTSGTFNGVAINMATVVTTATSVTFTTPTSVCTSTAFTIVLNGITNPWWGSSGNATVSIPNVSGGTDSYTTYAVSIANSIQSFFDYTGGLVTYATANTNGWCIGSLTAGQTYCYTFIYPSGTSQMEIEVIQNSSCGTSTCYTSSGNSSIGCASAGCSNIQMFESQCTFFTNGMKVGAGCPMTAGTEYTLCYTVPSGCTGASFCPMANCLAGNCASIPLPIELLFFDAKLNGNVVDLNWATATEINNDYFTLQKTVDGTTFFDFLKVQGSGNTITTVQYSAVDDHPFKGSSYYRLKQTDYDGKFAYSKIIPVEMASSSPLKLMYVAPYQSRNRLQYQFSYTQNKPLLVEVIDIVGQTVYSQKVSSDDNGQVLNMDASSLSKGVYLMKISDGIYSEVKKFVY